uniref:Uncharacterized protein n=1 Tax=Oryza meridionalis TaxID=40149 RepID=A0A0E0CVJ8_9ORYZ
MSDQQITRDSQLHGLHSLTTPFSKLYCIEQQVQDITLALALASLEAITWDKAATYIKHAQGLKEKYAEALDRNDVKAIMLASEAS